MKSQSSTSAQVRQVRRRGAGRPSVEESEKTRQNILDAALYCFGEFGYKRTANRLIAERARLTTGTIYHYFDNKRDLFMAAHESTQDTILRQLQPVVEQPTFRDSVAFLFDAFQTLLIEQPNQSKFNAIVRSEARRNPELSGAISDDRWRNLFREMTQIGIETGEINSKDALAVRNILSVLTLGLTQHSIEASNSNHFSALRAVERLIFEGFVKPPKRKRKK